MQQLLRMFGTLPRCCSVASREPSSSNMIAAPPLLITSPTLCKGLQTGTKTPFAFDPKCLRQRLCSRIHCRQSLTRRRSELHVSVAVKLCAIARSLRPSRGPGPRVDRHFDPLTFVFVSRSSGGPRVPSDVALSQLSRCSSLATDLAKDNREHLRPSCPFLP